MRKLIANIILSKSEGVGKITQKKGTYNAPNNSECKRKVVLLSIVFHVSRVYIKFFD